ncbi:MAG: DUF5644 domain-containing protein [Helicobacter sp.]|nr:DUF5644 domain-containing protein [Helicobacter sp.]
MHEQIHLEIVRFDIKKDYLPYTHRESVILDETEPLSALFALLDSHLLQFGYNKHRIQVRINDILVHKDMSIGALCERFGREWRLESYAPKATAHDLLVNTELLSAPLALVREVCPVSSEEEQLFLSLLPFCFLAPLSQNLPDYAGEGFFLFVAEMIKMHPQKASELMQLLASPTHGVMNAQLLRGRIFPDVPEYDTTLLHLQKALLIGYPYYDTTWLEYAQTLKSLLKVPV